MDAVAGGGGLILLPALLAAGLPPHLALGTNKLAGTFGTLSASAAYVRRGIFRPRRWAAAILATFVGTAVGTLAVGRVSAEHLERLIPPVVMAAGVYVLLRRLPAEPLVTPPARPCARRGAAVGSVLGFYDGFVGPGTGAFWTAAGIGVFGLGLVQASGLARFMNFVSNAVSLATFAALGLVHWPLGLAMGAALAGGAWIGVHSALRFGAPFIRPVFVAVVLVLSGKLAWEAWA